MTYLNKFFLASLGLGLLASQAAHAQQGIGTGATAPRTMLDVNGAISVTETTTDVTSNTAAVPTGFTFLRLTGNPTGAVTLTPGTTPAPVTGQLLTIYNATLQPATLSGFTVQPGLTLSYVYSAGAWQATAGGGNNPETADNGLTKTGNNIQLGGALVQPTTVSAITAANTISFTSPTTADAQVLVGNTAGAGGRVVLGSTGYGIRRDLSGGVSVFSGNTYGNTNDVALYASNGGSVFLATNPVGTTSNTTPVGQFVVTKEGYVGIGLVAPGSKFVIGTGQGTGGADDDYSYYSYSGAGATANQGSVVNYFHGRGTATAALPLVNGDEIYAQQGSTQLSGGLTTSVFQKSLYTGDGTTNRSYTSFGTSGAERMRIGDAGQIQFNNYTAGAFPNASPTGLLGVDATGNVVQTTATNLLTSLTANNGLTKTGNNVQLGSPLVQNTDVALNGFNQSFSGAGNFGIGTPSPGSKLFILNTTGRGNEGDDITLTSFTTNDPGGPGLLVNASRGTIAAPIGSVANDKLFAQIAYANTAANGPANFIEATSINSLYAGAGNGILTFQTGRAERMRIGDDGRVGIGTTTAGYTLDVNGNGRFVGAVLAPAFTVSSDRRLKRNIAPTADGLNTVLKLNPVQYDKKATMESTDYNRHEIGFIAQELQKVLPSLVIEGNDASKTLAVSYTELIPVLTKAIQEQQAQIEALKTANARLQADGQASANTVSEMQAALQALRADVQSLKAASSTASAK